MDIDINPRGYDPLDIECLEDLHVAEWEADFDRMIERLANQGEEN